MFEDRFQQPLPGCDEGNALFAQAPGQHELAIPTVVRETVIPSSDFLIVWRIAGRKPRLKEVTKGHASSFWLPKVTDTDGFALHLRQFLRCVWFAQDHANGGAFPCD